MEPTLHEGDIVIGVRSLFLKIKKGDVLIFKKNNKTMIKRVVSISRKSFRVEGDNTIYSIDSRHFGDVNKNEVIAKIVKTVHAHE